MAVTLTLEREQRTVRMTFKVEGAPAIDGLDPKEITLTFTSGGERQPTSDVHVSFGNVNGHWPVRNYFLTTERYRPRPDWIKEAVAAHAPEWWNQ
ncbi:hypothetical protein [Streptomyces sp. NPDC047070]|uniref:hypothetical protein n=1 Tax=Streptomyces sp. NPDC047070 TaxID=3154923 RepID=UPI0034531A23